MYGAYHVTLYLLGRENNNNNRGSSSPGDKEHTIRCMGYSTVKTIYLNDSNVKDTMYNNSLCVHDIARNFPCTPISLAKHSSPMGHCYLAQHDICGLRQQTAVAWGGAHHCGT